MYLGRYIFKYLKIKFTNFSLKNLLKFPELWYRQCNSKPLKKCFDIALKY